MDTLPVILDTDIGSDIDDAVALAYLLRQPKCELLGITTVSGEADKRASIADALCKTVGRADVQVHVGVEIPLLSDQHQPLAPHYDTLGSRWDHRDFSKKNTAIDFLRQTIHSRPGEITLLAIGPLTNIALLFAVDPEIPSLLKQLAIMGGWYFTRGAVGNSAVSEWNILCDPHAAAIVCAAPRLKLTAIGLDVSLQCQLPADECRKRFAVAGGALAPVAAMAEEWFKHSSTITFHDPLAAATLFEPALCEIISGKITVELEGSQTKGMTLIDYTGKHEHLIAKSVNVQGFFEHYFNVVNG